MTQPHNEQSPTVKQPPRLGADFNTRVVSAIAMAIGALTLTLLGGWPFALLVIAGAAILSWEWTSITRGSASHLLLVIQCIAIALMIAFLIVPAAEVGGLPLWVVVWGAGLIVLLVLSFRNGVREAVVGLNYIALPSLALVWIRMDGTYGLTAVIFLFIVVWGTDILAYVCGRYFGGPKLWPAVSPKKTWSGAIGGTSAAIIGGLAVAAVLPEASAVRLACVAFGLSVVSQIGDLAESALKRRYDVKDSSALIPGHGGLMDRVDGLLFAAFAAGLYALASGPADMPGKTLLVGG